MDNPFHSYLCKYTILLHTLDKYWFEYYYVYMFKYLFRRQLVLSLIIYCKNHRRRPVCTGRRPCFRDIQADIPTGWCPVCGSEIFEQDTDRCIRCRNVKGDREEWKAPV